MNRSEGAWTLPAALALLAILFAIQSEFRYEITRKIFEGGMGIVYEALQKTTSQRVALKMIVPQAPGGSNDIMARFIGGHFRGGCGVL